MHRRPLIAIGIDPGLTGAVAALSLDPRTLAVRSAVGVSGYYRNLVSGGLDINTALRVVDQCITDVIGANLERTGAARRSDYEVWGVVEQPGLWDGQRKGARQISRVSGDQRTWRNALQLRCTHLLPDKQAQSIDKRAGLHRSTVGRKGRKLEVRQFNLLQVTRGVLPPFLEVPNGCSAPQDGIHDAVLMALATLKTASGGVI
jgi:hypothetical protein